MLNPQDYTGRADGPGKFEGEMRAAEYYYEALMNGDGEDVTPMHLGADDEDDMAEWHGPTAMRFEVSADESDAFTEDTEYGDDGPMPGDVAILIEDTQGFVFLTYHGDDDEARQRLRDYYGDDAAGY